MMTDQALTWIGIIFCLSQSAMFSGLNLALLGIPRLSLEVESSTGNRDAVRILRLRQDTHFVLTTVLWGNVGINVLLTLLSNSVLAGVSAFIFSTVFITFLGEIAPQAYFSRNALRMGALLYPVIRFYQYLLYPLSRPSALVLDWILGREGVQYFREHGLHTLIQKHIDATGSDIDRLEGIGAMNFFALDDLIVGKEGEELAPGSIISLPHSDGKPVFPDFSPSIDDPFMARLYVTRKRWIVITDDSGLPTFVINTDDLVRDALFGPQTMDIMRHVYKPVIVKDVHVLLGQVIARLLAKTDDINNAVILVWSDQKRVITWIDILERLLQGVAHTDKEHLHGAQWSS